MAAPCCQRPPGSSKSPLKHRHFLRQHMPRRCASRQATRLGGEYLLPGLIAGWKSAHPRSHVLVQIANTHDVFDSVAEFSSDIGFIEGSHSHPQLTVRKWRTDHMVIIAPPGHPMTARRVSGRQLASASWVLREPGSGTREASDRWLIAQLSEMHLKLELSTNEAGCEAGSGSWNRFGLPLRARRARCSAARMVGAARDDFSCDRANTVDRSSPFEKVRGRRGRLYAALHGLRRLQRSVWRMRSKEAPASERLYRAGTNAMKEAREFIQYGASRHAASGDSPPRSPGLGLRRSCFAAARDRPGRCESRNI